MKRKGRERAEGLAELVFEIGGHATDADQALVSEGLVIDRDGGHGLSDKGAGGKKQGGEETEEEHDRKLARERGILATGG